MEWGAAEPALDTILARGGAARIGDTGVASRWVHTIDARCPQEVVVVGGADAGRVFYGRAIAGEIVHLDVFHSVGELDHRAAAHCVRQAVAMRAHRWEDGRLNPDYFDIQTATGGGRVTGALNFGQRTQLRRAHLNHVHVAARVDDGQLGVLLDVVAGLESEIVRQGLELRKVEQVVIEPARSGDPGDLTPYQTATDSRLKASAAESSTQRVLEESISYQVAVELAEDFGGIEQVLEVLDSLERPVDLGDLVKYPVWRGRAHPGTMEALLSRGLARREGQRLTLTDDGFKLRRFIKVNRHEIEAQLRRLIRRVPGLLPGRDRTRNARPDRRLRPFSDHRLPATNLGSGEWAVDLAVAETAIAAALGRPAGAPLTFEPLHIRFHRLRSYRSVDICLLIDASASMAGRRLRAAKFLAQHLLLSTRERVAVIAFQENASRVHVPFTRDYQKVQRGLVQLQPIGLTPLAEGLMGAAEYIASCRARNPLILLITDGIPTVPKWSLNPLEDAMAAAGRLPPQRIRLCCIGLEPNQAFLGSLAESGRGSLYIVDELNRESLVSIAHRERKHL
jgi:magnesium chelatase subunit D